MAEERGDLSPGEVVGVEVRALRHDDLARLVKIDEAITGRRRTVWYERKLREALEGSDVAISLGAERDGLLVGAVMGSVYYGEFGLPEPAAVLDTVLVDPAFARQGIARAMLEHLLENLRGLRIATLRTEVDWNDHDLVAFFAKAGFAPVPRLVLEMRVSAD